MFAFWISDMMNEIKIGIKTWFIGLTNINFEARKKAPFRAMKFNAEEP
jgi:hypothetical protein